MRMLRSAYTGSSLIACSFLLFFIWLFGTVVLVLSGSLGGLIPFMSNRPTESGKLMLQLLKLPAIASLLTFVPGIFKVAGLRYVRNSQFDEARDLIGRFTCILGTISMLAAIMLGAISQIRADTENFLMIGGSLSLVASLVMAISSLGAVARSLKEHRLSSSGRHICILLVIAVVGTIMSMFLDLGLVLGILMLVSIGGLMGIAAHVVTMRSLIRGIIRPDNGVKA